MRKTCLAFALTILLFASQASHAAMTCLGPITYLAINTGGSVYVSVGSGIWAICSVATPFGGVATDTCKAWYASLLAAQKTGQRVQFYFTTGTTCSAVGDWVVVTPNLYHMDLMDY